MQGLICHTACNFGHLTFKTNDVVTLEAAERRSRRLFFVMTELSYLNRLNNLCLYILESRRMRSNIIQIHKIIRGLEV